MLAELQFYTIDPEWLGSESEDFEGDGGDGADMETILRAARREAEGEEEFSPMQEAMQMMKDPDTEQRIDEMNAIAE